jgi:predicted ABC-type ATPase
MTNEEIRNAAINFAKKNKEQIARELTDLAKFHPEDHPISVFMAGSPGAGKTEFSKNLIGDIEKARHCNVVRIDADDIRIRIPGYSGGNSYLFQSAASIIVERIHDFALKQNQTFILDGTLANSGKAWKNIERSLGKNRIIFIFYLYQQPGIAWKFTQAREATEGRNIPRSAFIEQFIGARDVVEELRKKLGEELVLFLVRKNLEKNTVDKVVKIVQGESIDRYLDKRYTKNELETLL